MRKVRLTESELVKIIKKVISEDTPAPVPVVTTLKNRKTIINKDDIGSVTIHNRNNQPVKIKLSSSLGDIKVGNIQPDPKNPGEFTITGYLGRTKNVDGSKVDEIINFVDSSKTEGEISQGFLTLKLKKIN